MLLGGQSLINLSLETTPDVNGMKCSVITEEWLRVLSNLMDNAIESLPKTGGRVRVQLALILPSLISVAVMDTGSGIPKEILPKLFARGATFGKTQGTGLGLFHAKSQIESWGGKLEIASTSEIGTSIRITLPISA
jgi:signal transduction histidine kinase